MCPYEKKLCLMQSSAGAVRVYKMQCSLSLTGVWNNLPLQKDPNPQGFSETLVHYKHLTLASCALLLVLLCKSPAASVWVSA